MRITKLAKPDTVQITSVQMTLCNQAYKAIKIDNNLQRNLCQFWSKFEAGFLDSCCKSIIWYVAQLYYYPAMVLEADRRNKGANAGRDRPINLGTVGDPVH